MTPDPELTSFLAGVVGVIEANSYERHMLWIENRQHPHPKTWEQLPPGRLETVGHLDDRPVCVSLLKVRVGGHPLLFFYPTSQVVDHAMIDLWLTATLPPSAMHPDGYPNRTDAMNFHNVFPHRDGI